MAKKEIGTRIVVKGEKEYRQAIRNASQAVKTLQSELKAETAELGKNATEQQKNELKAKSLKKQIQEQEKAVAAHRKALEEAREQYADNEQVIRKYELQLNQAREALANMHNQLDGLGEGMKDVGADAQMATVATKSLADSLGSIADVGSTVSDAIEGIFSGMINTVKEAIATVWDDMMGLASKANAWMDLAGYWNTDAETIQKWERAVKGAHNSFDDLQSAVTRINMGDQQKITGATGVSGEAYEDKWQYAMAVMDALNAMDYDQRLEAAGEVFGEKRATKIMDLLNDWQTIQEGLKDFDVKNGGLGLTNEQISDMAKLAEQVDHIKETWNAFLESFLATNAGELTLDLTGNAQRILDDLIKYLDTGDDKDLEKLEKDIEAFFDRIKEAVLKAAEKLKEAGEKLEESDNGIVRAIGAALKGLADTLKWLSDENNINLVIKGFEALAAFWVAGKGAAFVSTIAELAANLKTISIYKAGGNAVSAAAGAGSGAAASGATAAGSAAAAGGVGSFLAGLAGLWGSIQAVVWAFNERNTNPDIRGSQNALEQAAGNGELLERFTAYVAAERELDELFNSGNYTDSKAEELVDKVEALKSAFYGTDGAWELMQAYSDWLQENPAWGDQWRLPEHSELEAMVGQQAQEVTRAYTDAQKQAAEDFWDVWRGTWTDEEFDEAYKRLVEAFTGDEDGFNRINELLDQLMNEYNGAHENGGFNENDWMDIPSTWWQSPAGSSDNGITRGDLQAFNALPVSLQRAAKSGVAEGVSGLQISMDGYAVGRIVAPYVSQMIAQEVV